jgi:hypothetical protein
MKEVIKMENNQEIIVSGANMMMEGNSSFIMDLTAPRTTQFSSVDITKANDVEKKQFFNAINATEKRIGDCINEVINIKHVFVEVVTCINKETGENTECPRTVLIDDKGVGYQAVSLGVFSSLKKLFGVYGIPQQWKGAIKVKVKQITKGERKILNLELV